MDKGDDEFRDALKSLGGASDIAGEWSLDQYIHCHAYASADVIQSAANEIDNLKASKKSDVERMGSWTTIAVLVGFVTVVLAFNGWQSYRNPNLWISCIATVAALIARQVFKKRSDATDARVHQLNQDVFWPLGVAYVSDRRRVLRLRSGAPSHTQPDM